MGFIPMLPVFSVYWYTVTASPGGYHIYYNSKSYTQTRIRVGVSN